jgi:hypothetical protein
MITEFAQYLFMICANYFGTIFVCTEVRLFIYDLRKRKLFRHDICLHGNSFIYSFLFLFNNFLRLCIYCIVHLLRVRPQATSSSHFLHFKKCAQKVA